MPQSSAAGQIYPHLPSATREPSTQREQSLASAMYPSQTPEARARDEWNKRQRDILLRNLREANGRAGGR
jgi:hypothetical protein